MKKALLSILCFFSIMIQAQTEHLKFMGIPLDGSITAFHTKLQGKGLKYDAETTRQLDLCCRCYRGSFSGEKASFFVYYNEKTKIVYRAKAVITYQNKELGEEKFKSYKSLLKTKYSEGNVHDDEQNGHPALTIVVPDSKMERKLGYVSMYINNAVYSFIDEVYLNIDYEDRANSEGNESSNMDDL